MTAQSVFIRLATALALAAGAAVGQVGHTETSLDWMVGDADLVLRGKVVGVAEHKVKEPIVWLDVTLDAAEILKGPGVGNVTIAVITVGGDKRWAQFVESGQEQLWFLARSDRQLHGEDPSTRGLRARHQYKTVGYPYRLRLGDEVAAETTFSRPPQPLFTMEFELLEAPKLILETTREIIAGEPQGHPKGYSFQIPRSVAQRTGRAGDANSFIVPGDGRLEKLAHRLIASAEEFVPKGEAVPGFPEETVANWHRFSSNRLRAEGAKMLRGFKSDENVTRLMALLDHPAVVGKTAVEEKEYFVRKAAYEVLRDWKIGVEKPLIIEGRDARRPESEAELRYWLENMVWHHRFGPVEVAGAIDLEAEDFEKAQERFKIYWNTKPKRPAGAPLLVLPYPGGRHPRTGFLDGAIRPQRETKISVFVPWDDGSYVVVDVPEAIWSNLGLTYLAHTHVPTIWTEQGVAMEKLEWKRRNDGTLDMQRKLPNGIEFGTRIIPRKEAVLMEMWLRNGTDKALTDLRVQNCVLLKGALGFDELKNENKVLRNPYVAVHNEGKNRWIITAWDPCHRPWANQKCPCMHSDPKFPDCPSGETRRIRGWLSFYEGTDLEAELTRIEASGWRTGAYVSPDAMGDR